MLRPVAFDGSLAFCAVALAVCVAAVFVAVLRAGALPFAAAPEVLPVCGLPDAALSAASAAEPSAAAVLAALVAADPLAFAAVADLEVLSCGAALPVELPAAGVEPASLLAFAWSMEKICVLEEFDALERVVLEEDELEELLLILSATSHHSIGPQVQ